MLLLAKDAFSIVHSALEGFVLPLCEVGLLAHGRKFGLISALILLPPP